MGHVTLVRCGVVTRNVATMDFLALGLHQHQRYHGYVTRVLSVHLYASHHDHGCLAMWLHTPRGTLQLGSRCFPPPCMAGVLMLGSKSSLGFSVLCVWMEIIVFSPRTRHPNLTFKWSRDKHRQISTLEPDVFDAGFDAEMLDCCERSNFTASLNTTTKSEFVLLVHVVLVLVLVLALVFVLSHRLQVASVLQLQVVFAQIDACISALPLTLSGYSLVAFLSSSVSVKLCPAFHCTCFVT